MLDQQQQQQQQQYPSGTPKITSRREKTLSSPYYVDPASMTPLQKHCAFFDRNGDGLIMPWETFEGMRLLGYNLFLCLFGTFVIHFFFSYWTLDSWVPDPFFTIILRNVHRLKHGSDSGIYDHNGNICPTLPDAVNNALTTFDSDKKGGLNLIDILWLTRKKFVAMDFFGWAASKLEWSFLWILCQKKGVVGWNDIREQYDGSLFERIVEQNCHAATNNDDISGDINDMKRKIG